MTIGEPPARRAAVRDRTATWLVLDDDGLAVAGTATVGARRLDPGALDEVLAAASPSAYLDEAVAAHPLAGAGPVPTAIDWAFPVAFLATGAGALCWAPRLGRHLLLGEGDLARVARFRRHAPIADAGDRDLAGVLAAAGVVRAVAWAGLPGGAEADGAGPSGEEGAPPDPGPPDAPGLAPASEDEGEGEGGGDEAGPLADGGGTVPAPRGRSRVRSVAGRGRRVARRLARRVRSRLVPVAVGTGGRPPSAAAPGGALPGPASMMAGRSVGPAAPGAPSTSVDRHAEHGDPGGHVPGGHGERPDHDVAGPVDRDPGPVADHDPGAVEPATAPPAAVDPPLSGRLPVWLATCVEPGDGSPLALGMIHSAIAAHDGGRLRQRIDLRPIRLEAASVLAEVGASDRPGILLLSNYFWTLDANVRLAAAVKQRSPETLTVLGGPAVPGYPERVAEFLPDHPWIDVLVHGEGEATIREVVDRWSGGATTVAELVDIAGLSVATPDGIVRTADRPRLEDLNTIPSPYLTGSFDHLTDQPGIWALETNRGCPYGCTFCDWGTATNSRIRKFDLDRVKAELDWIAEHDIASVFVTDANFGIFERDVEIARHAAALRERTGLPKSIIFTFAKNTVKYTLQITRILEDAGIATEATISFQTTDPTTLVNIRRKNIKMSAYDELSVDARQQGLPVLADLMMGLPGSTLASFKTDLQACIERNVTARVFATLVLENSPMNEPAYRREHGVVTDEHHQLVAAASFTEDDREEMVRFRDVYRIADHFGVLRLVMRFVARDHGWREVDVLDRISRRVAEDPGSFPTLHYAFTHARRAVTPSPGWPPLLAEARRILVEDLGIDPASGLDTVLAAQEATLVTPGRSYPHRVVLDHDVAEYYRLITSGTPDVPPLVSFGPAELVVGDPDHVAERGIVQPLPPRTNAAGHAYLFYELGWNDENNWELDSPLARVTRGAYT